MKKLNKFVIIFENSELAISSGFDILIIINGTYRHVIKDSIEIMYCTDLVVEMTPSNLDMVTDIVGVKQYYIDGKVEVIYKLPSDVSCKQDLHQTFKKYEKLPICK